MAIVYESFCTVMLRFMLSSSSHSDFELESGYPEMSVRSEFSLSAPIFCQQNSKYCNGIESVECLYILATLVATILGKLARSRGNP